MDASPISDFELEFAWRTDQGRVRQRNEDAVVVRAESGLVVVADGVSWLRDAPGRRTINALTSQRLTDRGKGSTFYDTKVDVRAEN